ncbi:MAG: pSRTUE45c [Marmoricola sp.]|nr:pSRTUE45c [Marmoricola sp.]
MAKVRTPRSAWIDAALKALAVGGPEAVRVEALATDLGVTKGGFYWHFADRPALLGEMLDVWEQAMVADVITRVDSSATDPRARLRQLFALAPTADFQVELAIRDWSRREPDVARRLRRVDKGRMDWLRSLFIQFCGDDDAEARSMLAYSLLIGGYFVAPHGGRSRRQLIDLALDRLLADGDGP